jgi:tetratricopeptide (TPR) repeat protein
MMLSATRSWLAVGCCLWCTVGGVWAAGHNPPLTTAELLVDLARDYGLSQRGRQTAADVQHVRTLLRAAVRLDPKLPDAYVWLYELASLTGDQAEAARMLAGLLNADPTNQTAFARWLTAGLRAQQTVEKRVQWLEEVASHPRPAPMQALVHVELARLALDRLDLPEARRQVARALELEPASLEAAELAVQALDRGAAPAERLRAWLRVLRGCPFSVETAWQVGLILDEHGFAADAGRFYEHARDVHSRLDPQRTLPGRCLLDLARHRLAIGQIDQAIELASQATAADPLSAAEAGMLWHYLLTRKGQVAEADQVRERLSKRFAPLTDPREAPVNEVAQAAWFYCTIAPDAHRAGMLAKAAAERAPQDPFVQRVLGWAQSLNLQAEEAQHTLRPIADRDPYAAYMLAKLLREAGEESEAQRVLERLDPKPTAGPAYDLLRELGLPLTTTQPAEQRYPDIRETLAEFDPQVLEFHQRPDAFLDARIAIDDLGPMPGEPWWASLSLTNRGPFPITLGPDAMVNPVFLLSFTLEGDRAREYSALMTVSLDSVRVLHPGQTASLRRTLDVGPVRSVSRHTPQQLQRVTVQAVLDAQQGPDGQWQPSLGGQRLRPAYFNRLPAATGQEAIEALFSALALDTALARQGLTGESQSAQVRAVEVLAELLGERQRAELKGLNYRPGPVPADRLRGALLSLLGSESWELRVRTLEGLQVTGLDRRMTEAVEQCLTHPHWLVRLMAVRVLARQGPSFSERAEQLAREDDDELVRALAESYLTRWGQAASGGEASASATGNPKAQPR